MKGGFALSSKGKGTQGAAQRRRKEAALITRPPTALKARELHNISHKAWNMQKLRLLLIVHICVCFSGADIIL